MKSCVAQLYDIFSLAYVWSLIHRKLFPLACAFSLLFVLALAVRVGFLFVYWVFCWGVGGVCVLFGGFLVGFFVCCGVCWLGFFGFFFSFQFLKKLIILKTTGLLCSLVFIRHNQVFQPPERFLSVLIHYLYFYGILL